MKKRREDRLVIIDEDGIKTLERFNIEIEESTQDNGKTLKLFIKTKK